MSYTVAWHPDLPALIVHYQGNISADEYRRMCAERAELLDEASSDVMVVMDMQAMQDFSTAQLGGENSPLHHKNVRHVLIVLDEELYPKVAGSVVPDTEGRWPVHFFPDMEQALAFVQRQSA